MQALPEWGSDAGALQPSEAELTPLLEQYAGRIDVAAVNGPQSVVVSGDENAVLAVGRHFEAQGRRVSRLRVSHAFHSRRMEEMLEPFGRVVRDLQLRPPTLPIISNVSGTLASADELTTAEYWVLHVRRTVRFYQAVQTLERADIDTFFELGPQSVLSALVQEGLSQGAQGGARLWPALRKECDEVGSLLRALGGLYAHGQSVDWSAFFRPLDARTVPLPTYAFEHQRYWLAAGTGRLGTCRLRGWHRRSIRCWVRALRWRKGIALSLPVVCRWRRIRGLPGTGVRSGAVAGQRVCGACAGGGRAGWPGHDRGAHD